VIFHKGKVSGTFPLFVKVTRIAQITTAAGTFKAFKLVDNDHASVGRFGNRRSNSTMRKRRLPMKQIMPVSVVFLSLALVSSMPTNLEAAEDTGQAAAPVYKGGSWVYRVSSKLHSGSRSNLLPDGDYEITFEEGKRRIFQLDNGQKVAVSNPGNLTLMLPTKGIVESDLQYFQFPLAVGKKWTAKYYSGRWLTAENSVTGTETVTTAAGSFSAIKIERQLSMARASFSSGTTHIESTWTYFYSPQTRSVLKYHYQSEQAVMGEGNFSPVQTTDIELIKFDPAEPK
jgi:hypothetical protein